MEGSPLLLVNETNATLSIPTVRALDAGGYFAVVTNGGGSLTTIQLADKIIGKL